MSIRTMTTATFSHTLMGRLAHEAGHPHPAATTLGERPDLLLAQRNQGELGGDEQSLDDDQRDDDENVDPDAHGFTRAAQAGTSAAAGLQSGTRSG